MTFSLGFPRSVSSPSVVFSSLFRALSNAADGRDAHASRAHAHEAGGRRLRGRPQAGQVVALLAVQSEVPRGQVQRAPARKQEPVRAGASPPIPPPTRGLAATRAASRPLASAELGSSRRCTRVFHLGSRVSAPHAPRLARTPRRGRPVRSLVRDKTSPRLGGPKRHLAHRAIARARVTHSALFLATPRARDSAHAGAACVRGSVSGRAGEAHGPR